MPVNCLAYACLILLLFTGLKRMLNHMSMLAGSFFVLQNSFAEKKFQISKIGMNGKLDYFFYLDRKVISFIKSLNLGYYLKCNSMWLGSRLFATFHTIIVLEYTFTNDVAVDLLMSMQQEVTLC